MPELRPIFRAGRIVGFRDENNFPVSLRDGMQGQIPLAHAPLVRQKGGKLIITGGNPEAVAALVGIVEGATKTKEPEPIELGKEPKPCETPGIVEQQEARQRAKPGPKPKVKGKGRKQARAKA